MKCKVLGIFVAFLISVCVAYVLGYKKGGHDLVLLEQAIVGKLAAFHIQSCMDEESPSDCYASRLEFHIHTALISNVLYYENVSSLSGHVYPMHHEAYDPAIEYLLEYYKDTGMSFECGSADERCREYSRLIDQLAQEHP